MCTSQPQPDRRDFLIQLGSAGATAMAVGTLSPWSSAKGAPADPISTREVDYYESLPGNRIQCHVCPLNCTLEDGQTCFCRTRTNVSGRLRTRAYDNPCVLRVEAIEKTPLNHFRPGSRCLTLGVGGCNARCLYCQNWEQSQALPEEVARFELTPQRAVQSALDRGIDTIAFNYTEPVAFLEYALDIAKLAKARKLNVVCATAGFINPDPLIEFAKYVDAFVVTIKGFTETFYHDVLGIRLAPVLLAVKTIRQRTSSWLEIAHLIVPGHNDDLKQTRELCAWVCKEVGPTTPVHLARFVPAYKLDTLPQTPVPVLEDALRVARQTGLKHAYLGNVAPHPAANTCCPRCSRPLIERGGFDVLKRSDDHGQCPDCRLALPGVWS